MYNNSIASSSSDKCELVNNFFTSCFNNSTSSLLPPASSINSLPLEFLSSPEEVYKLILKTPSDSACGLDEITPRMLHKTASSISFPLSLIFNSSLSTSTFPSDWKNSLVVPITKSNPPSCCPSSYCPISLLSLVSKVLERYVFNLLYDFCCSCNILSNCQFGFRPGFSTESALLSVIHCWSTTLDKVNSICSVFFDLSKAFDSVPHSPLINVLSHISLHQFLVSGSQQVVINGYSSTKTHVSSGVPQGSILGPLLFIIYMNSLSFLSLLSNASLTLYADDIVLSQEIYSPSCMLSVQYNINLIVSWISSHFLSVNNKKTKHTIITRKRSSFDSFPPLFLNNIILEHVFTFIPRCPYFLCDLSFSKAQKLTALTFLCHSFKTLFLLDSSPSVLLFFSLGPSFQFL